MASFSSAAGPSRSAGIDGQTLQPNSPAYGALIPNRSQMIRVTISSEITEVFEPKQQAVRQYGRGGRGSKPGLAMVPISERDVQGPAAAHQTPQRPSVTAAGATGTQMTQPDSRVFGRGGLGSRRPRYVDPKPLLTPDELRAQMASISQGLDKVRRTGRGGAGSAPVGLKGKELDPSSKGVISPSQSTVPRKLKLMRKPNFKGLGRARGSNDSLSPSSHSPSSPRSLSLHSSALRTPRSRFSNDTFTTSNGMESVNSSYLIPNQPPNSEVATTMRSYSPPFSAASTWSTHEEEGIPLTPLTTRSSVARPGSPIDSEFLRHDQANYDFGAVPSSVIRSAEFLNFRARAFPTATQDDLSLDVQTPASKRESLNRINRRASVSVTSMLSSPSSSAFSNLPNTSFLADAAGDRYSPQSGTISIDSVHQRDGSTAPPLPPKSVDDRSPAEVTAKLSVPVARDPDDDGIPTPTSRRQNSFISPKLSDTRPEDHSHPAGTSSHSRPVSRASSSEAAWHLRPDTPFLDRPPVALEPGDYLPTQAEARKEQVEMEIGNRALGPMFISRYEPKQGWVGVWNRGDMDDVIDCLRELRSPKGLY